MLPDLRRLAVPLAFAAVLAPWALRASRADDRAARAAPAAATETLETSLRELDLDPLAALGRVVHLRVQIDAELASWNPYITRFGSGDFRAWRAWGDEQFLWRAPEWENPLGTLHVRRGSPAESVLGSATRFARYDVIGRVRQVFLGRAWIEIEHAERLSAEVDEASLVHASRATLLAENERWALALEALDSALAGQLPSHAREELWRLRGEYRAHDPR